MLHRVVLPQLGQTMEEGTIEKWHKTEGDTVEKGEVLYELTTDKATLEVEAFAAGTVRKILVSEGETVPVNRLIAVIGDEDEELPEHLLEEATPATAASTGPGEAREAPPEPAPGGPTAVEAPPGRIFASPRARKIAGELEVPLQVLHGSGPGGRIIERDVRAYVAEVEERRPTPAARRLAYQRGVDLRTVGRQAGGGRVRRQDVQGAAPGAAPVGPGRRVPLSPMRTTIAQRMTASKQQIPHFYLVGEVVMDAATEMAAQVEADTGERITITALLVKAAGLALRENPRVNARFDGDAVLLNGRCNVGVAVAVEDGLFVPVIRDADARSLAETARQLQRLASRARNEQLIPEDYEGGSITLSNLGMYGIDYFQAIINPPESCILGIGTVREQPVARDGMLGIARMMKVSLSADHRVVDGVQAARFFQTFRELLESPEGLRE